MSARPRWSPLALLLGAALVAGCGSSDDDTATAPPTQPAATASAEDFPSAKGKTLGDLQGSIAEGPVLAPAVSILKPGRNRFAFALFDRARKQVSGAQVAVYVSRTDGSRLRGPFVARDESLVVKPQFRSRQTATDQDSTKSVYVADVDLPSKGNVALMAVARLDGRLLATSPYGSKLTQRTTAGPPDVGDKAPVIHTLTRGDVGGDLAKIDTRIEPIPAFHEVDFADVVGRKPVVLVFATPQLCASRVCGPTVDVAYQVSNGVGDRVDFIHQEIYNDNQINKGFRPQVGQFRLASEPWTFVVGSDGRIASRFEGAMSVGELERAVAKVK
ncbi:hypothetical protein [Conexibacter sp. SYSU D00693]|uniref:hypothetical protein n=1 Tax=Conexibacter sp. SYSU D00693 TaxID=2812560 RepID=UPI00196B9B8E|nr:hypothetical protein [Conexibacter sp. SYSU D00693]